MWNERNELLGRWHKLVPLMHELVAFASGPTWEQLQHSADPSTGALFYDGLRNAAQPILQPLYATYRRERRRLKRWYSYSVPSNAALDYLAGQQCSFLEIGAGKGFWAALLLARGVSITATDLVPPARNSWVAGNRSFVEQLVTGLEMSRLLETHAASELLLQWIPPGARGEFAFEVLERFQGKQLFVVGEPAGGACASDRWFCTLDDGWECVKRISLPRFVGVVDSLYHYVRRPAAAVS